MHDSYRPIIGFLIAALVFWGCSQRESGGGSGIPPGNTGETVTSLAQNPISCICATTGGRLFLGSNGGKILTSSDGVVFRVLDGRPLDIRGAHCDVQSAAVNVWFVGGGGTILYFDGAALAQMDSGTAGDLNGVYGSSMSNVFAVGDGGTVLGFDGVSWSAHVTGVAKDLYGVSGVRLNPVFAVGQDRTVLASFQPSMTWSLVGALPGDVPPDTKLNAVWADPVSGRAFIVGEGGTILRSSGGTTFERLDSKTAADLYGVYSYASGEALAVGSEGVILYFDGYTWTAMDNPAGDDFTLRAVYTSPSGVTFAAGGSDSDGVLLRLFGRSWGRVL